MAEIFSALEGLRQQNIAAQNALGAIDRLIRVREQRRLLEEQQNKVIKERERQDFEQKMELLKLKNLSRESKQQMLSQIGDKLKIDLNVSPDKTEKATKLAIELYEKNKKNPGSVTPTMINEAFAPFRGIGNAEKNLSDLTTLIERQRLERILSQTKEEPPKSFDKIQQNLIGAGFLDRAKKLKDLQTESPTESPTEKELLELKIKKLEEEYKRETNPLRKQKLEQEIKTSKTRQKALETLIGIRKSPPPKPITEKEKAITEKYIAEIVNQKLEAEFTPADKILSPEKYIQRAKEIEQEIRSKIEIPAQSTPEKNISREEALFNEKMKIIKEKNRQLTDQQIIDIILADELGLTK